MTRSVATFAFFLALHSAGCEKKDAAQITSQGPTAGSAAETEADKAAADKAAADKAAADKAAADKAAADKAAADKAAAQAPLSDQQIKERRATVKALQEQLDVSARKLASLHQQVAKIAGLKKVSAEKSLAEVDSAHVNIQADLAKLNGPEADDFDGARSALEAGIKAFQASVDMAAAKISGKPQR